MNVRKIPCRHCGHKTDLVICPKCGVSDSTDMPFGVGNYRKPIHSLALGVMAHQAEAATKWAHEHGVPVEFKVRGRVAMPEFTSPRQRKAYCQARGVIDLDGGYSDPT